MTFICQSHGCGISSGFKLLEYITRNEMVGLHSPFVFNFLRSCQEFFKEVVSFYIIRSVWVYDFSTFSPSSSTFSPTQSMVSLFHFSSLTGMEWSWNMALSWIFQWQMILSFFSCIFLNVLFSLVKYFKIIINSHAILSNNRDPMNHLLSFSQW